MRLDLFLKKTSIAKRRTFAKRLCDEGCVMVNDRIAKAGRLVEPGDVIELRRRERVTRLRVMRLPSRSQRSREAGECYEIIEERKEKILDL